MSGFVMCLFTRLLVCRSAMSEDHYLPIRYTYRDILLGLGATNQKDFPTASTPFTISTRLYHLIRLTQEYRGLPAACMQSVCTSSLNSSAELAAALFVTVAELSRIIGACGLEAKLEFGQQNSVLRIDGSLYQYPMSSRPRWVSCSWTCKPKILIRPSLMQHRPVNCRCAEDHAHIRNGGFD